MLTTSCRWIRAGYPVIQPLRRADRALLTAPQLTGAGAQRRGARPRGALRARQDLQLALFRGASNQIRIYSVMALSNQSGQLAERYGYTPYGKRRVVSPGGATLAASAVGNQVGFTGRYYDVETALTTSGRGIRMRNWGGLWGGIR